MIWEYTTVMQEIRTSTFDLQGVKGFDQAATNEILASMGNEGWELVNFSSILSNGNTIQIVYIFKRFIETDHDKLPEIGFDVDNNGITGSQL